MKKSPRPNRFSAFFRRQDSVARLPGLEVLDRYSSDDIAVWDERSKDLDELYNAVYIGPEAERRRRAPEISEALRSSNALSLDLQDWVRMVKSRYANQPLSCIGSLHQGGRFNIGMDADQKIGQIFPALYIADSLEIAYREFYQVPARRYTLSGLTPEELSLGTSSATFFLTGRISNVFDATSLDALTPVADVLSSIDMPERAELLMGKLGQPQALKMIKNALDIKKELTSSVWRAWPSQFGVPSASQQFAELVREAGFSGIRYESSKGEGHCLAVFPQNLFDNESFIELRDPCADSVTHRRISAENAADCIGWDSVPSSERRDSR